MSRCAENIWLYYRVPSIFTGMKFESGFSADAFKAGVSDKLLFNKILDEVIDNIESEGMSLTNPDIAGMVIM